MALPKLNEKLIKKILHHIREDYHRHEQDIVGCQLQDGFEKDEIDLKNNKFPACGTKACFGGWAVLLTTPKKQWVDLFENNGMEMEDETLDNAAQLLGLTESESEFLFDTTDQPNAKRDVEIIEKRLKFIRESRAQESKREELAAKLVKLDNQRFFEDYEYYREEA